MSEVKKETKLPFAEDFWREDGGQKWTQFIDHTEASLRVFDPVLLERAAITPGDIVLDIGCGGGLNSIELARRAGERGRVVGVDISHDILAVAGQRGGHVTNLEFREGDVADMSLDAGTYSLIFSRFGVMFFSDPVRAFSNLRRTLHPAGRMVFLCWRTFEENPWMREPAQAVFEIIPPPGPPPDPELPGPFSLGKKERIEYLLTGAGFTSVQIDAIDTGMTLGVLEDAAAYFTQMGPAAVAIADAVDDKKAAGTDAIRKVLKKYQQGDEIVIPAAAWLVSAR